MRMAKPNRDRKGAANPNRNGRCEKGLSHQRRCDGACTALLAVQCHKADPNAMQPPPPAAGAALIQKEQTS